jgi:hypothetical protein
MTKCSSSRRNPGIGSPRRALPRKSRPCARASRSPCPHIRRTLFRELCLFFPVGINVITKIVQMGFVGLILFIATACSGPNAGVNSAGVTSGKHKVWVPSDTGSHLGARWVEVGETGSAGTGALNVQNASAEQLQRQQLQAPSAGAPPSGATASGR